MINCKQLIDFLDDYVDGRLPAEQAARLEEHFDACPPCRDYLVTYRRTIELAGRCGEDDPPPMPDDRARRLVDAVLEALERS